MAHDRSYIAVSQHSKSVTTDLALCGAGCDYRLYRCALVEGRATTFYVTQPLSKDPQQPCSKASVVGIYDPVQRGLMSIVTKCLAKINRICSIADWRDGVVLCGPDGIVYLNAATNTVHPMLSIEIGASGFRCLSDIAVLPCDDSIWFTNTDYSFHDATASKIYCFDVQTNRLHVAASDIEVPTNIAFSKDSRKCYVSDVGCGCIFVYNVVKSRTGCTLASRTRFAYLECRSTRALRTAKDGSVYTASGNRIIGWDKNGAYKGSIVLDEPVVDFYLDCSHITVMQSQRILHIDMAHAELDARL